MRRQPIARLHITMPRKEADALRKLASAADTTLSGLVRRLVRDAMPRWRKALAADRTALL